MVNSFAYGDWDQICRNVPSMDVCNLFLKQQITLLNPAQYPAALALPDRSANPQAFDIAIAAAGVGVRSVCALPRMASAGGYPGSVGNTANIVCCIAAVILGVALAFMAGKRQAAVARWEMRAFFVIFALQSLFQLLSTGSFIAQNSAGLVWVTAIHLGLVVLLFWTLAWCTFLEVQIIEDGTLASFIPYAGVSVLLFFGFTYICLDTGFSVSGYFDTVPGTLHNNWLFTILIVLNGVFVLFTVVVCTWVAGMFLRERRPLLLYAGALFFFLLSVGAFWFLSQIMCINTNSKIDGSFVSTILTMISVVLLYLAWKTVTEDTWDEVTTHTMSEYDRLSARPGSSRYSTTRSASALGPTAGAGGMYGSQHTQSIHPGSTHANQQQNSPAMYPVQQQQQQQHEQAGFGQYTQSMSPIQTNYPYQER